jgi:hypothetical protein
LFLFPLAIAEIPPPYEWRVIRPELRQNARSDVQHGDNLSKWITSA